MTKEEWDSGGCVYAPRGTSPYGSFICSHCKCGFDKATDGHGQSGYCTQCEIGLGLIKIHDNEEDNRREQLITMSMLSHFKSVFPNRL